MRAHQCGEAGGVLFGQEVPRAFHHKMPRPRHQRGGGIRDERVAGARVLSARHRHRAGDRGEILRPQRHRFGLREQRGQRPGIVAVDDPVGFGLVAEIARLARGGIDRTGERGVEIAVCKGFGDGDEGRQRVLLDRGQRRGVGDEGGKARLEQEQARDQLRASPASAGSDMVTGMQASSSRSATGSRLRRSPKAPCASSTKGGPRRTSPRRA